MQRASHGDDFISAELRRFYRQLVRTAYNYEALIVAARYCVSVKQIINAFAKTPSRNIKLFDDHFVSDDESMRWHNTRSHHL